MGTQFYYIKVGCKGVFVTRTCFRDKYPVSSFSLKYFSNLIEILSKALFNYFHEESVISTVLCF